MGVLPYIYLSLIYKKGTIRLVHYSNIFELSRRCFIRTRLSTNLFFKLCLSVRLSAGPSFRPYVYPSVPVTRVTPPIRYNVYTRECQRSIVPRPRRSTMRPRECARDAVRACVRACVMSRAEDRTLRFDSAGRTLRRRFVPPLHRAFIINWTTFMSYVQP